MGLIPNLFATDVLVFCLLVNRVHFLHEQSFHAHQQTVSETRALLCEIVAIRILRTYDEDHDGPKGLLTLANMLVGGFDPFQNAPPEISQEYSKAFRWGIQDRGGSERKLTALELAIISDSKALLSTAPCQKVVDAIYQGQIVYTPTTFIDMLPDHYKSKSVTLYDAGAAPLLDQYRLIVPRNRNALEIAHFLILLTLYLALMNSRDPSNFTWLEIAFCVYAFGWILDQIATILEHGWKVYTQNLWAFLDVTFGIIYLIYFVLRVQAHQANDEEAALTAFDVLSMGAPVLIPRLAFNVMSENMLFVSLRDMMANFFVLSLLAVWCFGGFLLSMTWMSRRGHSPITISKWMLWVWFGLDATGIERSVEFHRVLGPICMVTFAFLGNTLFLTILVSMLSNTFSLISANATAEIQYRRAVLTFEGVKSDAIFSFHPPFNILALLVLWPLKLMLSPRWFHKVVVTGVRVLNAPLLLAITLYERRFLWTTPRQRWLKSKSKIWSWDLTKIAAHSDLHTVFEGEPPESVLEDSLILADFTRTASDLEVAPDRSRTLARPSSIKQRKESLGPFSDLTEHLHDILQDYGGVGENNNKLEAMEVSISRIEEQLHRLTEQLGKKDAS